MRNFNVLLLMMVVTLSITACISPWKTNAIYSGETGRPVAIYDLASEIPAGSVLVVTVERGFKEHAENVERLLRELSVVGNAPVSIGTDFIPRSAQNALDQYVAGRLSQDEFTQNAGWLGNDFGLYRTSLLFPRQYNGQAVAIGASRALTALLQRDGLDGLNTEDRQKFPPGYGGGTPADIERYRTAVGRSQSPEAISRNVAAREYANDFTAYIVSEFLKFHPEQKLVLLTDDFFNAYSGGIVNRLRIRGVNVNVISQLNLTGLKRRDEESLIRPNPRYGARAKYIWIERR